MFMAAFFYSLKKKKMFANLAAIPPLPSLSPRDASVLSLLVQHPDAPVATRNRLIKSLSAPAQDIARSLRSGLVVTPVAAQIPAEVFKSLMDKNKRTRPVRNSKRGIAVKKSVARYAKKK